MLLLLSSSIDDDVTNDPLSMGFLSRLQIRGDKNRHQRRWGVYHEIQFNMTLLKYFVNSDRRSFWWRLGLLLMNDNGYKYQTEFRANSVCHTLRARPSPPFHLVKNKNDRTRIARKTLKNPRLFGESRNVKLNLSLQAGLSAASFWPGGNARIPRRRWKKPPKMSSILLSPLFKKVELSRLGMTFSKKPRTSQNTRMKTLRRRVHYLILILSLFSFLPR